MTVPTPQRDLEMAEAIGSWGFCAHDYSDDELVHAAFLMLQHALAMPELENWRLPAGKAPQQSNKQAKAVQESKSNQRGQMN